MTRPITQALLAVLMSATLLFSAGCDDDDDSSNPAAPLPEIAQVRVAHLSPDAPEVDVWVDGTLQLEDVAFKGFSGYLELSAGDHDVMVYLANTVVDPVIDETVTVAGGTVYTAAATGLVGDSSLGLTIYVDDLQTTSDKARVQFAHASIDAPPVDITRLDGAKLFSNVMFGKSGTSQLVDGGAYSLQARVANTETVALSFADVPVSNGMNYTVYAIGLLSDGSITAIVTVNSEVGAPQTVELTPATAELQVAHLVPGAGEVDVYLDGNRELRGVPFEAFSGYLPIAAKTYTVRVTLKDTMTDVIPETALIFNPNTATTVAAAGLPESIQPLILLDTRDSAANGFSLVRFVHTSPDAPTVDIVAAGVGTLFAGYDFRDASEYAPLGVGTYDLEVRLASTPAGQGDLVKTFAGVTLNSTETISLFATDVAANLNAVRVQDNDE
jgi:hypothetical protein